VVARGLGEQSWSLSIHCGGTYRIHEHERAASSVRRVDAGCRNCGAPRTWWFRIVPAEPS